MVFCLILENFSLFLESKILITVVTLQERYKEREIIRERLRDRERELEKKFKSNPVRLLIVNFIFSEELFLQVYLNYSAIVNFKLQYKIDIYKLTSQI